MILDHIIKKFCSGRSDSAEFDLNKAVKFSFNNTSEGNESKAEAISYVLSRFSTEALKCFARSSAEEADEATRECNRLDKELDDIHTEIASIRTPENASENEKAELRDRRNEKRRIRDGIRYSLELALDKASELSRKADECCALVELVTGETVLYRKLVENDAVRTFSDAELISFADKLSSEGGLENERSPESEENDMFLKRRLENRNINGVSHYAGSYAAAVPAV